MSLTMIDACDRPSHGRYNKGFCRCAACLDKHNAYNRERYAIRRAEIRALELPLIPGEWTERAACRDHPIELWFPPRGDDQFDRTVQAAQAEAIAICRTCPVIAECREHGIRHEDYGVWGGLTAPQRASIRKQRRNRGSAA